MSHFKIDKNIVQIFFQWIGQSLGLYVGWFNRIPRLTATVKTTNTIRKALSSTSATSCHSVRFVATSFLSSLSPLYAEQYVFYITEQFLGCITSTLNRPFVIRGAGYNVWHDTFFSHGEWYGDTFGLIHHFRFSVCTSTFTAVLTTRRFSFVHLDRFQERIFL